MESLPLLCSSIFSVDGKEKHDEMRFHILTRNDVFQSSISVVHGLADFPLKPTSGWEERP